MSLIGLIRKLNEIPETNFYFTNRDATSLTLIVHRFCRWDFLLLVNGYNILSLIFSALKCFCSGTITVIAVIYCESQLHIKRKLHLHLLCCIKDCELRNTIQSISEDCKNHKKKKNSEQQTDMLLKLMINGIVVGSLATKFPLFSWQNEVNNAVLEIIILFTFRRSFLIKLQDVVHTTLDKPTFSLFLLMMEITLKISYPRSVGDYAKVIDNNHFLWYKLTPHLSIAMCACIVLTYKSSYWRRCILCIISRQSLNTLFIFSVSTAQVKCG